MPSFWMLFWSSFIPAGLIFLIVTKLEALAMKDSGKLSNTHVWVRSGSKTPQGKALQS